VLKKSPFFVFALFDRMRYTFLSGSGDDKQIPSTAPFFTLQQSKQQKVVSGGRSRLLDPQSSRLYGGWLIPGALQVWSACYLSVNRHCEVVMRAILPIVVITVVVLISLALVTGVSLGLGWVLTLIFPLSLFEGTVVGTMAAGVTWAIWHNILRGMPPFEDESDYETDEIPASRFWETGSGRTWENWFRYEFANSIYDDFLDSPRWSAIMGERQLQELAIRMADVAVGGLKRKSPRAKRIRVSRGMLKQELVKLDQQPYDDDILDTTVTAVNAELVHLEEELRMVIQEGLWEEQAKVFW
jgi:hypothetical protein